MYLLPLIGLFLGAVLGDMLWGNELAAIASAFIAMIGGFVFVRVRE